MGKRRVIRVFEYERLYLGEHNNDDCALSEEELCRLYKHALWPAELSRLYDYNDKNGNIYFTGIRNGIKFSSYVGVIQIGNLTIEILPKADKKTSYSKEDYNIWQNALLKMLSICNHISIKSDSETYLKRRHNSILDLYFKLFLDEVSTLIRRGLIKQYRKKEGNITALKGRLVFSKNIQQNVIHQERFYTEHQIYDYDHIYNQILQKAISILSIISNNSIILDQINRIKLDFPEVLDTNIKEVHFERLKWGRKTEPYRKAIQIARLIILNYSPDIKSNNENMLAILFDMNKLWEEYVYRLLQRAKGTEFKVSFQNSMKFWEHKTIRPDIVIESLNDASKYIIDTKWKIVDSYNPSDNDLKQMFAYNIYWGASRSILLYPEVLEQDETFGKFHHKAGMDNNSCKLGFVNILNREGSLDLEAGVSIFEKLKL